MGKPARDLQISHTTQGLPLPSLPSELAVSSKVLPKKAQAAPLPSRSVEKRASVASPSVSDVPASDLPSILSSSQQLEALSSKGMAQASRLTPSTHSHESSRPSSPAALAQESSLGVSPIQNAAASSDKTTVPSSPQKLSTKKVAKGKQEKQRDEDGRAERCDRT
ncbi:hypothetical protein IAR50_001493 [Cryptococcus sp. DSM 104548]